MERISVSCDTVFQGGTTRFASGKKHRMALLYQEERDIQVDKMAEKCKIAQKAKNEIASDSLLERLELIRNWR